MADPRFTITIDTEHPISECRECARIATEMAEALIEASNNAGVESVDRTWGGQGDHRVLRGHLRAKRSS